MIRTKVKSSNIESIGYDEVNKIIEIKFMNGGIYQYEKVEKTIFDDILKAESVGKFFYKNIKSNRNLKFKKIEEVTKVAIIVNDVDTQNNTNKEANGNDMNGNPIHYDLS